MKAFRVSGKFTMGKSQTPFTVETVGDDVTAAKERVLSTIGSRHRVNRHDVVISDVKEIRADEVSDPIVEKRLNMVK